MGTCGGMSSGSRSKRALWFIISKAAKVLFVISEAASRSKAFVLILGVGVRMKGDGGDGGRGGSEDIVSWCGKGIGGRWNHNGRSLTQGLNDHIRSLDHGGSSGRCIRRGLRRAHETTKELFGAAYEVRSNGGSDKVSRLPAHAHGFRDFVLLLLRSSGALYFSCTDTKLLAKRVAVEDLIDVGGTARASGCRCGRDRTSGF